METEKIDEMVSSLFTTDTLSESEYFRTLKRTQHLEPEKHLMLGVLKDAVDSFLENINERNARRQRQFKSAEKWFFEENTAWAFSFDNICGVVGLDPGYIRRGLRNRQCQEAVGILPVVPPAPLSSGVVDVRRSSWVRSQRSQRNRPIHQRRQRYPVKTAESV